MDVFKKYLPIETQLFFSFGQTTGKIYTIAVPSYKLAFCGCDHYAYNFMSFLILL